MQKDKSVKEELKAYDPALGERSGRHSFRVPDGYFERMQREVMDKISQDAKQSKRPGIIQMWRLPAIAATIVLLAVAAWLWQRPDPSTPGPALTEVAVEDYLNYLEEEGKWSDFELLYRQGLVDGEDWLETIPGEDLDQLIDEFLEEEEEIEEVFLNI